MTQVELHIGVHRLYGKVLDAGYQALAPVVGERVRYANDDYENILLPAISEGGSIEAYNAALAWKADIMARAVPQRIVISKSSILCQSPAIYQNGVVYSEIDRKLPALLGFFADCEVTIHLCITSMYDFLRRIRDLPQRRFESGLLQTEYIGFSWARLVREIAETAPDAGLKIWDCEKEHQAALGLIADLLDSDIGQVQRCLGRRGLRRLYQALDGQAGFDSGLLIPEDIGERLDFMYDDDLAAIAQIDGVTLIRQ